MQKVFSLTLLCLPSAHECKLTDGQEIKKSANFGVKKNQNAPELCSKSGILARILKI